MQTEQKTIQTENVLDAVVEASEAKQTISQQTSPKKSPPKKPAIDMREVVIADIVIERNPSRAYGIKQDAVDALAADMKQIGLLQPIMVTPAEGKTFKLLFGEHRLAAAKQLGWKTIRAIVQTEKVSHALVSFLENYVRNNLTPIDIGRSFRSLINDGFKQAAIAKRINKTPAHVSQMLNIVDNTIEEFQQAVHDGECPYTALIKYVVDLPEGNQSAYFKALAGDYSDGNFKAKLELFKPAPMEDETPPKNSSKLDSIQKEESEKNEEKPKGKKSENKDEEPDGPTVKHARTEEHARIVKEVFRPWIERKLQEWDEKYPMNALGDKARARFEGVHSFLPILERWLGDPNALVQQSQGEFLTRLIQGFAPRGVDR